MLPSFTVFQFNSCVGAFRCHHEILNKSCLVLKFLLSPGLGSWQLDLKSHTNCWVSNFFCHLARAVDRWSSNHWWGNLNSKIKSPGQGTQESSKPKNWNNQWFELQLSTTQARRQKKLQHPTRPIDKVALTTKGLQEKSHYWMRQRWKNK